MKRKNQRLLAIIVALILVLTGCGVNDDRDGRTEDNAGNSAVTEKSNGEDKERESLWNVESLEISKEYSYMVIADDAIYGSFIEDGQAFIERLNKESGEVENKFPVPEMPYIKYFNIDKEGYFNVIGQEDAGEIFARIAPDGSVEEVTGYILEDLESVSRNSGYIPRGIYTDADGYIYLWYKMFILASEVGKNYEIENVYTEIDRVYVKDEQLNTIFYEQFLDSVWDFQIDETGVPFLVIRDGEEIYRQDLDIEKEALGTKTSLNWPEGVKIYKRAFQVEDGFCFQQASGSQVWKYDYSEQKYEYLIDLKEYGLGLHQIESMVAQKGKVEMIARNTNEQRTEYIVLAAGESDKQVITLGATWISDDLARAIADFNNHSDELQVVSYWDGESNYEESIEKLKLDVVSGKAPDIIEVSDAYMSILVQKGVFSDLYTFMEDDEECQKDMLVENILELYEKDGHLYSISPAFYLYSLWGNHSVVQGRYGITLKDLQELLAENNKNMNAVYGFYSGTSVLETLCTFGMDELIDWENGSCDFEGEYFQDLLMFAKEYEEAMASGDGSYDSLAERVNEGEILLSGGMLCSVLDYQVQAEIFGGNLDIIGYPTAKGSGTAACFWGSQIAINVVGEHQKEAWEFVKSYLLYGYSGVGFPLVEEQFEAELQKAMETEYALSEDGVTKVEVAKGSFSAGGEDISVYEASLEDVEAVKWMVENASQKMQRYMEIQDIINEEAQAYFQGQKSLSKTAAIIQSRVTLYLQEQMW